MSAIVRVLWGDDREHSRQPHVINSYVKPQLAREKFCPQWVYVYGKNNADLLTRAKIKEFNVVLVDPDPFPDGIAPHNLKYRNARGRMRSLHVHPWHNKPKLLLKALEDHGEIIYCDWDVDINIDDPQEAFDALGDRKMTFSISYYSHAQYRDRPTEYERRSMPSGCWIHAKGSEFIQAVLDRLLAGEFDSWHDEYAMRAEIELRHGGWPDEVTWLREFESPIMGQRAKKTPWEFVSFDGTVMKRKTPIPFEWNCMFRNRLKVDLSQEYRRHLKKT